MKTKKQKREAAIKYMQNAKHYSITAVAKRFNIPYNTVWTYDKKVKQDKTKVAEERAATRAAKEAKTAEFHAKKEQRITRADLVAELAPGLNDLFGFAKELEAGRVSDGSSADYYVLPDSAKELQDLISHKNMNAQIGEIFRACYRYGEVSHSDMLRDAKKIKFYAEAEIKRLERLNEGKD